MRGREGEEEEEEVELRCILEIPIINEHKLIS